jgi:hypothetical protein
MNCHKPVAVDVGFLAVAFPLLSHPIIFKATDTSSELK